MKLFLVLAKAPYNEEIFTAVIQAEHSADAIIIMKKLIASNYQKIIDRNLESYSYYADKIESIDDDWSFDVDLVILDSSDPVKAIVED